jgi:hypothetical protein
MAIVILMTNIIKSFYDTVVSTLLALSDVYQYFAHYSDGT